MHHLDRVSVRNKNRKKRAMGIALVLVILIIGLFFRGQVASTAHFALIPVNNTFRFILRPLTNTFDYFASKTKLQKENYELRDRNKNLEIEILSMKAIKDQNVELRNIEGLNNFDREERIVGQVILTPPFSPHDTFVAKITDDRFSNEEDVINLMGKPVFIKNILVGEILEIYGQNIVVKMFSTFGDKIPVKISNEIIAEAEGQGGLSFKITIPKDVVVEKSMPIFSMDQPGTILGIIKEIEVTEASSFQTLYFQYMFSYSDFSLIEIAI